MPINVEVKVEGLKEVAEKMAKLPAIQRQKFGDAIYESAGILAMAIRGSQRTPVRTGFMINKTGYQRMGMMGAVTFVATKYAAVLHQGIENDIEIPGGRNVFIPGVGWRHLKKIKARPARPFVDWALQDGAQAKIDARINKALDDIMASL